MKVSSQRENGGNTIVGRLVENMLRWYGHVVSMKDKRWPKRIMTWSPEGNEGNDGRK